MTKENLIELSKKFAIDVIKRCKIIREERKESVLVNQLLRSGTSVGANIHEANYASSRSDFINKMQIALKECYETDYWLEIFMRTNYLQEQEYQELNSACCKIRKMLTASLNTAKQNIN